MTLNTACRNTNSGTRRSTDYEYSDGTCQQQRSSRRRASASVAPPSSHLHFRHATTSSSPFANIANDQLLTPPVPMMSTSSSVHSSLTKRDGYSLDRGVKKTHENVAVRRESHIHPIHVNDLNSPAYPHHQHYHHLSPASSYSPSSSSTASSNSPSVSPINCNNNNNNNDANAVWYNADRNRLNEKIVMMYEIGGHIGQGNFSDVFVVYADKSSQKYAVKEVEKARMNGKLYFIENEISILRQCNHTNICRLIEAYESPTYYFIVFEYAQKGDLFETIKRMGRLTERTTAQITYQVASALHFIHSKNIVHRDIKPENILLNTNLTAKLTDFGLACVVMGPLYRVCGTPTYVAPEVLMQQGYGLEVDMWSLGILLHIMLIGFAPFRCSDRTQLFRLIAKANVSFSLPCWSKISRGAKQLILELLTTNVDDRLKALEVMNNNWIRTNKTKQSI